MDKKIIEQKNDLITDIMELRKDLEEKNNMINNLGKSVSFFNLFIIPFVTAVIVSLVMKLINITGRQSVGAFIIIFVLSFGLSTITNKRKIDKRKKELIDQRLAIQKLLVSKGKELNSIEERIAK